MHALGSILDSKIFKAASFQDYLLFINVRALHVNSVFICVQVPCVAGASVHQPEVQPEAILLVIPLGDQRRASSGTAGQGSFYSFLCCPAGQFQ